MSAIARRASEIWNARFVLGELWRRELRTHYLGSFSGILWVFIAPLAQLAIYAYIFVEIFKAKIPEAETAGFVPFLAAAFWPWLAFSDALNRSVTSIEENEALISKVALPHEVFVLSAVLTPFALHMLGYIAVLIVLEFVAVDWHWLWLGGVTWVLVLTLLLALAFGLLLAALQVFVRDLQHALGPLLMLWFFATPILYSPSLIPERLRDLQWFNPFAYIAERLRDCLLFGRWETHAMDWILPLGVIAFLAVAWWVFRRLNPRFEDFL